MHATLSDISLNETASGQIALDWVGMQDIDLPILVAEDGQPRECHGTGRCADRSARTPCQRHSHVAALRASWVG
ncbi:MAG: hypothetical protein CBARDMAM_6121 [uncultured Caballeronia sp.]|nr:MAG: hypothetical protein CBARDMAM_6121 [uncultured Caballeronia sp.]